MSEDTNNGSGTPNPGAAPPPRENAPHEPGLRLAFDEAFAADWRSALVRKENGAVRPSLANVYLILSHHEEWRDVIAYDEFACTVVKRKRPPFGATIEPAEWGDLDDARLSLWLAQQFGLEVRERTLQDAVLNVADAHRWHPVREYLERLTWDQCPRVRYWLRAYLGAEAVSYTIADEGGAARTVDYTEIVGTKFLVGAIARVMQTQSKFDHVLILEGRQGIGKSSAFAMLAQPWFTDGQIRIGERDTYEIVRGNWIVEMAELDAFNRAESAAAKAFFSRSVDRFRAFYGRRAATVPRQCVYVGTVNHHQYLQDPSGNRRYWGVRVAHADLKDIAEDRDQLWAEALVLYRAEIPWWVLPEESSLFDAEQEARYIGDAWESRIARYLEGMASEGAMTPAPLELVTTAQLLAEALHLDTSKWTRSEQIRVGHIMERLGWVRRRELVGGVRQWAYHRPSKATT